MISETRVLRFGHTRNLFARIVALGIRVNKVGRLGYLLFDCYLSELLAKSAAVFSAPTTLKYRVVAKKAPNGQPGKLGT